MLGGEGALGPVRDLHGFVEVDVEFPFADFTEFVPPFDGLFFAEFTGSMEGVEDVVYLDAVSAKDLFFEEGVVDDFFDLVVFHEALEGIQIFDSNGVDNIVTPVDAELHGTELAGFIEGSLHVEGDRFLAHEGITEKVHFALGLDVVDGPLGVVYACASCEHTNLWTIGIKFREFDILEFAMCDQATEVVGAGITVGKGLLADGFEVAAGEYEVAAGPYFFVGVLDNFFSLFVGLEAGHLVGEEDLVEVARGHVGVTTGRIGIESGHFELANGEPIEVCALATEVGENALVGLEGTVFDETLDDRRSGIAVANFLFDRGCDGCLISQNVKFLVLIEYYCPF